MRRSLINSTRPSPRGLAIVFDHFRRVFPARPVQGKRHHAPSGHYLVYKLT
jgi:hypothetical protein